MEDSSFISTSWVYSLQTPILKDTAIDYAEIAIDNLQDMILSNPILREIPLVKTALSLIKAGIGVSEAYKIKKHLAFIQTLQAGNPAEEELQKRVNAIKNGEKWVQKEAEQTLVHLERHNRIEKAQIQALLYRDLINRAITFEEYSEELEILDRLFAQDIQQLTRIYMFEEEKHKPLVSEGDCKVLIVSYDQEKQQRLEAIGLLYHYTQNEKIKRHLSRHGKHIAAVCVELSLHE